VTISGGTHTISVSISASIPTFYSLSPHGLALSHTQPTLVLGFPLPYKFKYGIKLIRSTGKHLMLLFGSFQKIIGVVRINSNALSSEVLNPYGKFQ